MLPYQTAVVALAALLIPSNNVVESHGYLKSPRSRNYVASEEGVNWMTASNPLISITPQIEVEPQSANIGGIDAQCGIIASSRNYDFPKNYNGQPLGADHQSCYATGEIIDIKIKLTAHHKGHFEVYACPIDDVSDECIGDESVECNSRPSKECFAANPLTFVSDELHGAVKDENYPVRAYLAPNVQNLHYKYKLPDGLKGDKVLIQWYYLTANSCKWEGYDEYDWDASGWGLSYLGNVASCPSLPPDGRGVPEQFWNCAEVRILDTPSVEACAGRATTVVDIPSLNSSTGGGDSGVTTQAPPTSIASTTGGTQVSTTTSQAPPSGSNFNYCGLTWADANDSCGQPCPGGQNSECTLGGDCFADATNCPDIYMEPYDGGGGSYNYCGATWADADASCSRACPGGVDSECLPGDKCFADAESCPQVPSGSTASPIPPPAPTPPATSYPTRSPNNDPPPEIAGGDSRLIAYLGNWEACPTAQQLESYTHIVVAFAVSYSYNQAKNSCNAECNIGTSVPICSTQTGNEIAEWRAAGKKVILSFGGAGMGGSWSGDSNNCWDDCFGREEELSTALVSMVESQSFDGIDIDYEYCYDTENNRHFGCQQTTSKYSDAKAQFFLSEMTYLLREKLDALGPDLELTHAPMDTDLVTDSPYYQILKTHRDKLNFLMPQFYNGITKPINGFTSALTGRPPLDQVYSNLANDMFKNEPEKIVFGFCISDCGATGSNTNAAQAVTVLEQVKAHNNGEFSCNGGAFFWVVSDDISWSDLVYDEVSQTAGCSSSEVTTTLAPPSSTTSSSSTVVSSTTTVGTTQGTTSQQTTTATTTQAPPSSTSTSVASTTSSSNQSTSTEAPPSGLCSSTSHDGCTSNQEPRCGRSELEAREHCNAVCQVNTDCPSVDGVQQFCWGTHANYCGSFPKRTYSSPVQAHGLRCGFTEVHARTFCGVSCAQDSDCVFMGAGAGCHNTHTNYCGSDYTTDDSPPPVSTTQATTTESTVVSTTSQQTTSSQTTSTEASTIITTTSTTESVSSGHCTSSCSTCSPYTLIELRAMGNTNWHTDQSNCDKCANGYKWWPCNVDICKCGN